jgi:small subunit ribosomal protein S18
MQYYKKKARKPVITETIDYKDTEKLKKFINEQGKILPRRITGLTIKQHRQISKSIKRARIVAILTFVASEN